MQPSLDEREHPRDLWWYLFVQQMHVVAVPLLAGALVLVLGILAMVTWRGGHVRFVGLGSGVQAARPGEVPQGSLEELAFFVVRLLGNTTPQGLPSAIEQARAVMTPAFRVIFGKRMEVQHKLMLEHDVVMLLDQLSLASVEKIRRGREPVYRVHVQGVRVLWVGALKLTPQPVTIMLELAAVISSTPDFAGVWINDMEWPIPNIRDDAIAEAITAQTPGRARKK